MSREKRKSVTRLKRQKLTVRRKIDWQRRKDRDPEHTEHRVGRQVRGLEEYDGEAPSAACIRTSVYFFQDQTHCQTSVHLPLST